MAEVTCWAIGIAEVRDMFVASPTLTERLLASAESLYEAPRPVTPQPGLLGKLGPLLRRPPDAPVIQPDRPTRVDAERLIQGRFVAEARLPASWALLRHWLDEMSWATASWPLTEHDLNTLDFDLARAGVVSQHGVRHLWSRDARLSLRPTAGNEIGYQRHDYAVALGADWTRALPQLDGDLDGASARTAAGVAGFLGRLPELAAMASGAGRPAPDVVTLRTR